MARKEQVTCDVCGAQKQDSNHWFILLRYKGDDTSLIIDVEGERAVYFNDPTRYGFEFLLDLCGEACVLKKVSELISKQ